MFNPENCEIGTITIKGYRQIKEGKLTYHYHTVDKIIHHRHDALLDLNEDIVDFEFVPHSQEKTEPKSVSRKMLDDVEFKELIKKL